MDKRSALFRRGDTLGADWFFVVDADEVVLEAPDNLEQVLREVRTDAVEVSLREPFVRRGEETVVITEVVHPWRMLFRAVPGIQVKGNHYTYITPDGRVLWAAGRREQVPAERIQDLAVVHRCNIRSEERKEKATAYYAARDLAQIET